MEADNIDGKKEPKRLPVWACIPLFIVVLFIFIGLYGTLVSGGLSFVTGLILQAVTLARREIKHLAYLAEKAPSAER